MAGSDSTGGDSRRVGDVRLVPDTLKDRLIMALIAVIFGGGTTISYQNMFPETVRPDPWTGRQAVEAHAELADKIIETNEQSQDRHDAQESRLQSIETRQALDDAHRDKASEGWRMIYEMHEDLAVLKERLRNGD